MVEHPLFTMSRQFWEREDNSRSLRKFKGCNKLCWYMYLRRTFPCLRWYRRNDKYFLLVMSSPNRIRSSNGSSPGVWEPVSGSTREKDFLSGIPAAYSESEDFTTLSCFSFLCRFHRYVCHNSYYTTNVFWQFHKRLIWGYTQFFRDTYLTPTGPQCTEIPDLFKGQI